MNSRCNCYHRLLLIRPRVSAHSYAVHRQTTDASAQFLSSIKQTFLLIFYHNATLFIRSLLTYEGGFDGLFFLKQHIDNIAVSGRHCKGKVNSVLIILEFKFKLESIVVVGFLLLELFPSQQIAVTYRSVAESVQAKLHITFLISLFILHFFCCVFLITVSSCSQHVFPSSLHLSLNVLNFMLVDIFPFLVPAQLRLVMDLL